MSENATGRWLDRIGFGFIEKARADFPTLFRTTARGAITHAFDLHGNGQSPEKLRQALQAIETAKSAATFGKSMLELSPVQPPPLLKNAVAAAVTKQLGSIALFTPPRESVFKPTLMEDINRSWNNRGELRRIENRPMSPDEREAVTAILAYLDGRFNVHAPLWTRLALNESPLVASSALVFHARELSRNGRAAEAIELLNQPMLTNPDPSAFANMSMRINLEIQRIDPHKPIDRKKATDLVRTATALLGAATAAPVEAALLDRSWLGQHGLTLYRDLGLGAIYTAFNASILAALSASEPQARAALNNASTISAWVGGLHDLVEMREPEAKTALRMTSLVALAADHLHADGTLGDGDAVRDHHLRALLLDDVGHFGNGLTAIERAIPAERFVVDPALHVGPILAAELEGVGHLPGPLRPRWTALIDMLHAARRNADKGDLQIAAFARSTDATLERTHDLPRAQAPEYLDAHDFRFYATRRTMPRA